MEGNKGGKSNMGGAQCHENKISRPRRQSLLRKGRVLGALGD